jgi:hypothetical protein
MNIKIEKGKTSGADYKKNPGKPPSLVTRFYKIPVINKTKE